MLTQRYSDADMPACANWHPSYNNMPLFRNNTMLFCNNPMLSGNNGMLVENILTLQEAVKERLYDGELAFGQLTVAVTTDDAPGHTVGNAKELPDAMGGLGREFH